MLAQNDASIIFNIRFCAPTSVLCDAAVFGSFPVPFTFCPAVFGVVDRSHLTGCAVGIKCSQCTPLYSGRQLHV